MFSERGQTRPLFQFAIGEIPVAVQGSFLLVTAIGAMRRDAQGALVWVVVVAASILWHELGHALAMRRFGFAPSIELVAMGGLAHWPPRARPTAHQAFVVTASGPAAGLILGLAAWALDRHGPELPDLAWIAVQDAIWVNLAWSLVNLLPILPLDGGRLLDHGHHVITGRARPQWVGYASVVAGGGLAVAAISRQMIFAAIIAALGVVEGLKRVKGEA